MAIEGARKQRSAMLVATTSDQEILTAAHQLKLLMDMGLHK